MFSLVVVPAVFLPWAQGTCILGCQALVVHVHFGAHVPLLGVQKDAPNLGVD